MKGFSLRNIFLPSSKHSRRALIVHHPSLLIISFLIIGLLLVNRFLVSSEPLVLGYATDVEVESLLKETNKYRSEVGLDPLTLNPELNAAAKAKAEDMFSENYWAHISPSGKEPWDFIVAAGYEYSRAGENLAVDFDKSENVVSAWDKSPTHQANLLNPNYTEIGFAVVNGKLEGRKTTLVVQMFGEPRFKDNIDLARDSTLSENNPKPNLFIGNLNGLASKELTGVPILQIETPGTVLNSSTIFNASRDISIALGLFLSVTFAIDGYYVYRYGINRVSGKTIFHVLMLCLLVIGIWYTNIGLVL